LYLEGRRKKEEGRRKKEEVRGKKNDLFVGCVRARNL
jgi:hypothetical protein